MKTDAEWIISEGVPGTLPDDWGAENFKQFVRAIQADALRYAADLCAKVSPRCGELKDRAIRDCIRIIYAEADKLTQ